MVGIFTWLKLWTAVKNNNIRSPIKVTGWSARVFFSAYAVHVRENRGNYLKLRFYIENYNVHWFKSSEMLLFYWLISIIKNSFDSCQICLDIPFRMKFSMLFFTKRWFIEKMLRIKITGEIVSNIFYLKHFSYNPQFGNHSVGNTEKSLKMFELKFLMEQS